MSYKIFIVEDNALYGKFLKQHLSICPDFDIEVKNTGKECIEHLYDKPDVICIDYGLPDMKGDELLVNIHSYCNNIPVVVISGQNDIAVAVNLLKSGASDYIIKDEHTGGILLKSINNIVEKINLKKEIASLKEQLEERYSFEKSIIGQSEAIKRIYKNIQKAITSNINVSITGETGTGKEVVAKAIHFNSERRKKPFVAINMAAIPDELVESELFGHEKGAFTGAVGQKIGKFEEAHGGTIFLDEVAELNLNLQSKILRVIQEREVIRIGGNKSIKINVRLVSATHKNLNEEVKKGRFREDLFYRIMGMPIELPPLRHRNIDILLLAKHYITEFSRDNYIKPPLLDSDAKEKLMKHNYPGNVRELKAVVDLACVMCDGNLISADDIKFQI